MSGGVDFEAGAPGQALPVAEKRDGPPRREAEVRENFANERTLLSRVRIRGLTLPSASSRRPS